MSKTTINDKSGAALSTTERKPLSPAWFIPLALVLAVLPLVTIIHVYDCGLEENPWFSIGGRLYDFFLYYKAFFLRIILLVLIFLIGVAWRSYLDRRAILPMAFLFIFAGFSLTSAILSSHPSTAFFGGYEQFEGWITLFAYMLCFYFAYGHARSSEVFRFLMDALLIGSLVVGMLGFFQAIGIDWIQSGWAKYLLTPELMGQMDISKFNIKLNFDEGMSYVTLYNPNYVGSYVALTLPYCLMILFTGGIQASPSSISQSETDAVSKSSKNKKGMSKLWRRIVAGVTSVLLIVTLIASRSLTGVLGLLIGGVVCGLLLIIRYRKYRLPIIASSVALLVACAVILYLQPAFLSKLLPDAATEEYYIADMTCDGMNINILTGSGKKLQVRLGDATADSGWGSEKNISEAINILNGTTISGGTEEGTTASTGLSDASIETQAGADGHSLSIVQSGYEPLRFTTETKLLDGSSLATYLEELNRVEGDAASVSVTSSTSDDDLDSDNEATAEDINSVDLLHVTDGAYDWSFTVVNGKVMIYNDFGRLDDLREIPQAVFEGRYYFASRRGYIWSRTLPLLQDHLLLGVGADHFVYAFPNDDYVGKRYMGYNTQTITKPHDMFLQIWMQDGLPALIAFLALYILFIVRAFRVCMKKSSDEKSSDEGVSSSVYISFVITTAVAATAYMIVGLANDSTITVAPMYWTLLGLGFASEQKIFEKN